MDSKGLPMLNRFTGGFLVAAAVHLVWFFGGLWFLNEARVPFLWFPDDLISGNAVLPWSFITTGVFGGIAAEAILTITEKLLGRQIATDSGKSLSSRLLGASLGGLLGSWLLGIFLQWYAWKDF